jgi:hypothetical protein
VGSPAVRARSAERGRSRAGRDHDSHVGDTARRSTLSRRFPDFDRFLTGLVALSIAAALAAALAFVSHSVNRPPVITSATAQPQPVPRGGASLVDVTAHDPDGDALVFEFKADTGALAPEAGRPMQARYSPAETGPIADRVTITVSDARGMHTTTTIAISIEGGPAAPPPTPEPTLAPVASFTQPPPPTATPKPTRAAPPPTAIPPPTSAPTERPNRPPVLQEGTTIGELGDNPIVLVATGNEPDGEPITFSWDFGPCLESKNVTQFEAEVKLIGECSYAVPTLTWSDPQGATATAQWQIHR